VNNEYILNGGVFGIILRAMCGKLLVYSPSDVYLEIDSVRNTISDLYMQRQFLYGIHSRNYQLPVPSRYQVLSVIALDLTTGLRNFGSIQRINPVLNSICQAGILWLLQRDLQETIITQSEGVPIAVAGISNSPVSFKKALQVLKVIE
jgi:hypothetical protein